MLNIKKKKKKGHVQNSAFLENPTRKTLCNGCLFNHNSLNSVTCQLSSLVELAIGSYVLNALCVNLFDLTWLCIFFLVFCLSSGTPLYITLN